MNVNQLNDDGAVIGYNPILEYKKETNNSVEPGEQTNSSGNSQSNYKYSDTLNGFLENTPGKTINNLENTMKNITFLIDSLSKSFNNGNWNQYGQISSLLSAIESDNQEYIQKFVEYHRNFISGSIIPELIKELYDEKVRIRTLRDVLSTLYYGKSNYTLEEIKEKDESYTKQLRSFEESGDINKINYVAITYDSMVNRSTSLYSFTVNEKVISIADVINQKDNSSTNMSRYMSIKNLYDEINDEINYRRASYDKEQSVEIMGKTLYNYYNKRQALLEVYDLFNENPDSIFFGRKIEDFQEELNNAVINVNRAFVGNQFYLNEIANLEKEKKILMDIYETLNYNLAN